MAFGASDANNIEIKVTVDASGAVSILDSTGKALAKVETQAKKADTGITSFQGKLISLEAAASLAMRGFNLMRDVIDKTFTVLERAETIENVTTAFNDMSNAVGNLSEQKLKGLQAATEGTITKLDLMRLSNQAMMSGMDQGNGTFEKFTAAVIKIGEAKGKDGIEALDGAVQSLSKGMTKGLTSLSVFVEKQKEGETRAQFYARAMEATIKASANVAKASDSAASAAETLGVAWEDAKNDIAAAFSQNEDLRESLDGLKTSINGINVKELGNAFADFASKCFDLATYIAKTYNEFVRLDGFVRQGGVVSGLGQIGDEAEKAGEKFYNAMDFGDKTKENAAKAKQALSEVAKQLDETKAKIEAQNKGGFWSGLAGAANQGGLNAAEDSFYKMYEAYQKYVKEVAAGTKVQDGFGKGVRGTADEVKKGSDEQKKLTDAIEEQRKAVEAITGTGGIGDLTNQYKDLFVQYNEGELTAMQLADALTEVNKAHQQTPEAVKDATAAMKEGQQAAKEYADAQKRIAEEMSKGASDAIGGIADAFNIQLPQIMSDAIGEQMQSIGLGMSAESAGWVGMYANALSQAAEAWNGAFADTLENSFKTSGQKIEAFGRAWLGMWMGQNAITQVWAKFAGQFWGKTGFFGTNNEQTAFRHGVAKWFEQAFDGQSIKLIIENQLQEIKGIDMSKYIGGMDNMSAGVAGAFSGLGDAIGQALKGNENWFAGIGDQITSALANATGGELINLRVLFQQLNLSADDLLKTLNDAYMRGDIGAKQLLEDTAGLVELTGSGLPGAINGVAAAYDEMIKYGKTSGYYLGQSFKDMAAEAKKAGATTVEQYADIMVAQGKSREEANKWVAAMKAEGITTMDQLANLDPQKLASIEQTMERLGVPLMEAAKSADELVQKLTEIQETDWSAKVKLDWEWVNGEPPIGEAAQTKSSSPSSGLSSSIQAVLKGANLGGGSGKTTVTTSYGGASSKGSATNTATADLLKLVNDTFLASQSVKDILFALSQGLLNNAQAGKQLHAEYRKTAVAIKDQAAAQAAYEKALTNLGKVSDKELARLMKNLDKANAAVDKAGGSEKSADDKLAALQSLFKSGKISAEEYATKSAAIKAGAGMGLPGYGDVSGALDAVMNAKNNKDEMAALKTLFAEGAEGKYTLGSILGMLQQRGFDTEKLKTTLSSNNINDITSAVSASDDAIINMINSLHGMAQPWKDATRAVKDYNKEVDKATNGGSTAGSAKHRFQPGLGWNRRAPGGPGGR